MTTADVIDIGDGKVTFRIPILLMMTIVIAVAGGFISASGLSWLQTYDNSTLIENNTQAIKNKADITDIHSLQTAINTNQEYIKANQGIATGVQNELADLENLVVKNTQAIVNLTDTVTETFEQQSTRDYRQWERIHKKIDAP